MTQNGEPETVFKTSGPVSCLRAGEEGRILAIVNRNTFYEVDSRSRAVVRCIRFKKHSITAFYCQNDQLVFGNTENKVLVYDLRDYDPDNPDKLTHRRLIEGLGGWVLCMEFQTAHLYMGCDDRKIRVYRWPQVQEAEQLAGHDDGVIALSFADNMLYSGSYDNSIRSWDIKEMMQRVSQRGAMAAQDVESKKYQVYYGVVFKNKKKKLPAKKKKPT